MDEKTTENWFRSRPKSIKIASAGLQNLFENVLELLENEFEIRDVRTFNIRRPLGTDLWTQKDEIE